MKKFLIVAMLLATSLNAQESKKGVEALSPEVRALLSQEMQHIQTGMQNIFSHIVKGEYEDVSKIAVDIEASFIFKRKLTNAQRAELKEKIPKSFIVTDRSFHELAGALANAAEFEEKDNIEKYFSEMTQTCVKCHSTYATHRFPNLKDKD
jgi:cytochrome c556